MLKLRNAGLLLIFTLLIGLLAACGGSNAPVALADIPVFTGAEPMRTGASIIADTLVGSIEQGLANQNLTSTINLYRLPEGTTWASVKEFYTGQIAGDWKTVPELTQEAGTINILGWQRGGAASEQVLIAGQAEDPVLGETFLVLGLFSE